MNQQVEFEAHQRQRHCTEVLMPVRQDFTATESYQSHISLHHAATQCKGFRLVCAWIDCISLDLIQNSGCCPSGKY